MRKISIVQRRLEAGLDLTQAELRALQREAGSESAQEETTGGTATALADSFDFMPPMRPPVTVPPETAPSEESQTGKPAGESEIEEVNKSGKADFAMGGEQEGFFSERTENEAILDSIAAGLDSLFPEAEFEGEGLEQGEEETPDVDEASWPSGSGGWGETDWSGESTSDRDVLFPSAPVEAPAPAPIDPPSEKTKIVKGEEPGIAPSPEELPAKRDETLVLFLIQVPAKSGLAATFSSEESPDSPFAGQLRLRCRADGEGQPVGDVSSFDVNLPPEGLVRLSTGQASNNGHEWALVTLDEKAHAFATFDLRAGRNLSATAAVFNNAPSRRATIPLKLGPTTDRALVLANPTGDPVVVKLSLLDENGQEVAATLCNELNSLPAGKQVAVFARKVFRELAGQLSFTGSMVAEVVGGGAIWTAGLSQNENALSFLPVSEMKRAVNSSGKSTQPH